MGPTEINKGNARNYTLPTRSKSTITKTHTNFKKREREKNKQEIVCRVYTSQYKAACHDADKEGSRWGASGKMVTERKQRPLNNSGFGSAVTVPNARRQVYGAALM